MTIITAEPHHVSPAAAALSGHMEAPGRIAFHDKLRRYASKPDRALFLARKQVHFVGFSMVIGYLDPPEDLSPDQRAALQGLACGTGLMVLTPWRGQGIGRVLVEQWETWARERGQPGLWCVTHRMGVWYRDCLGYHEIGKTSAKGVIKTIMVKHFS